MPMDRISAIFAMYMRRPDNKRAAMLQVIQQYKSDFPNDYLAIQYQRRQFAYGLGPMTCQTARFNADEYRCRCSR